MASDRIEHAINRLFERYGVAIVSTQLRALEEEIIAGRAERAGTWGLSPGDTHQHRHARPVYEVSIGRRTAMAVWNPKRQHIVTFAPPGGDLKQAGTLLRVSIGEALGAKVQAA